MGIRKATASDFEQIKHIKDELAINLSKLGDSAYHYTIQTRGFLIPGDYTKTDHSVDIKKIFFVCEDDSKILGYLRVDEEHEMSDDSGTYWYKPEFNDIYFSSPHACVGGVGVLPEAEGKGIGTKLLQAAITEVKNKGISYLFSFITMGPVTNVPSMLFHEKNGFQRVMYSLPEDLFGMHDYQCYVYAKKL